MAIKAGELLHVGNAVLLDRLQSGGPGNLNIPIERIYELGNYETVEITRDIPDLTFSLESLDASAELEALLTGGDFGADPAGTGYDISKCKYQDVLSQFKAGRNATDPYAVVASAVLPALYMESLSYRFGVGDNASQQASLRGDSIYYAGGSAYQKTAAGSGAAGQEIPFDNAPLQYNGDVVNGTRLAIGVFNVTTQKRLFFGTDYTEIPVGDVTHTNGAVKITDAVPATETIRIVWQSATAATYPQVSHAAASATRPGAIKGRHIEVRVGGNTVADRWSSIQSVTVDWRATLERDEELGNSNVVAIDYDVPEVGGSIDIKTRDADELISRIEQIAGVTGQVVGAQQVVSLPIDIILHSPTDGSVLKTLYIPDAKFTLPGYNGQVQQKLTVSMPFESDGGKLTVYKGARA